jgi:pimeloyl-ACP methyl ester carboxylesterase
MPYIKHIYYEESGSGHPVILIHCPGVSHVYWRPTMDRLGRTCRTIAVDLRGHGRSGLGDSPWTYSDISGDLALLTRRLGLDRPVLVGYSAGSGIALQAVLDEPDLYGGVVCVSGYSECCTLHLHIKVRLGLLGVNLGLVPVFAPSLVGSNSVGSHHSRQMIPDAKQVRPESLRSFYRETIRHKITDRLWEIQQPVLLVYGTKDDVMHRYYRILRSGLPNARSVFFARSDHRVPTRRPEDFADAVAGFVAEAWEETEGVPTVDCAFLEPGPELPQLHE